MNMTKPIVPAEKPAALRIWCAVALFAIAFAWVESAVVVYLREIYFNGGFSFPLVIKWESGKHVIDPLVRIEFGREIATIIMLGTAGWIAGNKPLVRFSYFLIAFGLWDIFYYIWLRVMAGWPKSMWTWDLLFYVPLPWVGPVITPVLIAFTICVAGTLIIFYENKGIAVSWKWYDMAVELGLGLVLIVAFCWDWKNILQLPGDPSRTGIPNPFAWWIYLPAYVAAVLYFAFRFPKSLSLDNQEGLG